MDKVFAQARKACAAVATAAVATVGFASVGTQTAAAAAGFSLEEVSSYDGPLCEGTHFYNPDGEQNSTVLIEVFYGDNAEFFGDFRLPDEAVSEATMAWVDLPSGWLLFEATAEDQDGNITLIDEYETYVPSCDEGYEDDGSWVYYVEGHHFVNGREWFTTCEAYSQTQRCTTDIVADTVIYQNGVFIALKKQRVFNNLTYLPSDRGLWADNPLGNNGEWTADDGRQWRTECDTDVTGGNGCRSYIMASLIELVTDTDGTTTYHWVAKETFNNIVLFELAA